MPRSDVAFTISLQDGKKQLCSSLTNKKPHDTIVKRLLRGIFAGIAQSVEQLICNQQVGGSSPSTSSKMNMGEFPSGQRGQTVNLLSVTSMVRIHPLPPEKRTRERAFFIYRILISDLRFGLCLFFLADISVDAQVLE